MEAVASWVAVWPLAALSLLSRLSLLERLAPTSMEPCQIRCRCNHTATHWLEASLFFGSLLLVVESLE